MGRSAEWIRETLERVEELEELVRLYVDQRRQVDPVFPDAYLDLDTTTDYGTLTLRHGCNGDWDYVIVGIDAVANMDMESARKHKDEREARELKARQQAKEREAKDQENRERAQLAILLKKYGGQ